MPRYCGLGAIWVLKPEEGTVSDLGLKGQFYSLIIVILRTSGLINTQISLGLGGILLKNCFIPPSKEEAGSGKSARWR